MEEEVEQLASLDEGRQAAVVVVAAAAVDGGGGGDDDDDEAAAVGLAAACGWQEAGSSRPYLMEGRGSCQGMMGDELKR